MLKKLICLTIVSFFATNTASARLKIPFGEVEKINIVAELPDTETYEANKGSKEYLDLACLHGEYNIAWFIPAWITKEPKLVLSKKDSEEYFDLTDEQLNQIIKENNLNKEELLNLGFYTKYGGKLVLGIIAILIIWGIFSKSDEPEEVKQTNV